MKVGTRLVKFQELKNLLNSIGYQNVLQVSPVVSGNSQEFLVIYRLRDGVIDIKVGDMVQVSDCKDICIGKVESLFNKIDTGILMFNVRTVDGSRDEWVDEFQVAKIYGELEVDK